MRKLVTIKGFSKSASAPSICVSQTSNLGALKIIGWTDAETQTFTTVRGTFPASVTQQSGQRDAKKATSVKATDPATDPARAEFKLGIFPPDHHVPPTAPTPTPATPKP